MFDKTLFLWYNKHNERGRTPNKRSKKMKFYVIDYENGATRYCNAATYEDMLNYIDSNSDGQSFTVSEYDSEEDYFNNL